MNPTTESGDFKKWFVFSLIAIGLIVIAILTFQGYQTSSKAQEINASAQKLEKDTRESSELFKKLETIRKNEIKIDSNNTENDSLKGEIREIAKDLPRYGIESKSKFLN